MAQYRLHFPLTGGRYDIISLTETTILCTSTHQANVISRHCHGNVIITNNSVTCDRLDSYILQSI